MKCPQILGVIKTPDMLGLFRVLFSSVVEMWLNVNVYLRMVEMCTIEIEGQMWAG